MDVKKIMINISVISLAFLIFAIWHQNNIGDNVQTLSSMKNYNIYLITTDKEYQYWDIMNKGATEMREQIVDTVHINYKWDAPIQRNSDLQIEVIYRAIDQGADALLIAADDPKVISEVVEDAKAKGIKVIYLDSPAYEEALTTIGTNNEAAGVVAGQTMLSILEEKGIKNGTIGIISVEAKSNSLLRETGFRKTIEENSKFTILKTEYTNGEPVAAQVAAERLINDNSDLVGLFGTNEGTTQGVGYAIKANDNKFIGVGYDKTDVMLELLHAGNLKAIVVQNPYTMGYLGMAEAVAALQGKELSPYINTGVNVMKSEQ